MPLGGERSVRVKITLFYRQYAAFRNFHARLSGSLSPLGTLIALCSGMKTKLAQLTAGVVLALSLSAIPAGAIPINVTMIGDQSAIAAPASALSGFGDSAVFSWLKSDVAAFNTAYATTYPTPTANLDGSPLSKVDTASGPSHITLTVPSNDYAFLHWGGKNGGWEQAFYNSGADTSYTFNAPPGGHPSVGGLSFYSTYGSGSCTGGGSVPDGGMTIGLLGMALGGLVLMRKQ